MVDSKEIIQLQQQEEEKHLKLAKVVELFENGTAKIQFFGEDTSSEKEYSYLASYKPTINDTVLVTNFIDTYIILGKIIHSITIDDNNVSIDYLTEKLKIYALKTDIADFIKIDALNGYAKTSDLEGYYKYGDGMVSQNMNILGNLNHTGSLIKFFGGSLTNKKTVTNVSSNADLAAVRSALSDVILALKAYNLL